MLELAGVGEELHDGVHDAIVDVVDGELLEVGVLNV